MTEADRDHQPPSAERTSGSLHGQPGQPGERGRASAGELATVSPFAQALAHLTRDLKRIRGLDQRATPGVRTGAQRVAAEMLAAGATADEVRQSLTRLVFALQGVGRGSDDRSDNRARPREDQRLLADVLQCALSTDAPRDIPLTDERR